MIHQYPLNNIMAFESGELNEQQTIEFFQGLIDSGLVWQLQGSYGRTARSLIEAGLCTSERPELV
jgi:hypothetical protein